MTVEIKVPAMGESVTEATISKWFKKEGDAVKRDEPLLELETDKVTVEVPSPADGAIESISAQAGATVQVGALLGAIAEGKAGAAPAQGRSPESRSAKACCSSTCRSRSCPKGRRARHAVGQAHCRGIGHRLVRRRRHRQGRPRHQGRHAGALSARPRAAAAPPPFQPARAPMKRARKKWR